MKRIIETLLLVVILTTLSCSGPGEKSNPLPDNGLKKENAIREDSKDTGTGIPQGKKDRSNIPQWILVCAIILEGASIAILYIKGKKKIEYLDGRIEKRKKEIIELQLPSYQQPADNHVRTNGNCNKQTPPPTPKKEEKPNTSTQNSTEPQLKQPVKDAQPDILTLLVRHDKNGILAETEKEYAYYEIYYTPGSDEGKFYFSGDAQKAINNRSSVIFGVCDTRGTSENAKSIDTTHWGTCKKIANGKWQVTEKAIIEFKQ